MNSWHRIIEMRGQEPVEEQGPVNVEDLNKNPNGPKARIRFGHGYGLQFGSGKSYCEVELECDQTEEMLDRAGDRVFQIATSRAQEGVEYALDQLELDRVPYHTKPKGGA